MSRLSKKLLSNSFILFGLMGILAACSTEKSVPVVCPEVKVLKDTDHVTRFKEGPGRDITDITLQANLRRANGLCESFDDHVEVFLGIDMQASQGAALEANQTELDLIVGITDLSGKFVQKRRIPLELVFPANQPVINYSERLQIVIPLKEDQAPAEFRLYVGYGLSKEELRYNRAN